MIPSRTMPVAGVDDVKRHGEKPQATIEGEGPIIDRRTGFRFGRMFPNTTQSPMTLKLSTCAEVGARMTAPVAEADADSTIPAGYTYFGQFVDHDISSDGTERTLENLRIVEAENTDAGQITLEVEATPDDDLVQKRSPSLDLDSLYGGASDRDESLFNGPLFRIGITAPVDHPEVGKGHSNRALPFDLPRKMQTRNGKTARIADIADGRNDENLAVAQTHLMWLKFHNEIVGALRDASPGASNGVLFETARELVTKHYQHVVLHDFVAKFIMEDVYRDIIVDGNRKALHHAPGEAAFMPLEFSVAAYRHGHSQVRETYDWNLNFPPERASFRELFRFSEVSGNFIGGLETLPSNWIADYRRLYDFGDREFPNLAGSETGALNHAKAIDPYLATPLGNLPELRALVDAGLRPFANLAALNLRRGSMRGLPSGQDVSRELRSVRMMSEAQIRGAIDAEFDVVMRANGFYERTPLWLYILIEAKALGQGNRLGPLGSTIVADTFRTLALTSRISILKPGAEWTPEDATAALGAAEPLDTIPAILAWIDARTPIIDPLQDTRTPALAAMG